MGNICLVCGYDHLDEPPYDERGIHSDEICPCCGFHYGYDDDDKDDSVYVVWRKKWINEGIFGSQEEESNQPIGTP